MFAAALGVLPQGAHSAAKAFQQYDLCELPEIKRETSLHCDVEMKAYKEGSANHTGFIVTLNEGQGCQDDDCMTNYVYYLYTDDRRLIRLRGLPSGNNISTGSCIKARLGMESGKDAPFGGLSVSTDVLAKQLMVLNGDNVQHLYTAKPPFRGEVLSDGGWDCKGEFGYGEGTVSWPEAKQACVASFRRDIGMPVDPPLSRLTVQGQLGQDIAGLYYACEVRLKGWHNVYRVDLSRGGDVEPILIKKEEVGSFVSRENKPKAGK